MQIVYISNRPDVLRQTHAHVRGLMPFIDKVLVFCPADKVGAFEAIGTDIHAVGEEELIGGPAARVAPDHQRRNYMMRAALPFSVRVADEFIMSDDDYRPLRPIEAAYFASAGKHQPFFFYTLERWADVVLPHRRTSYDEGNLNTLDLLRREGLGTLLFSAHMPQIVDKRIFGESVRHFAEAATRYASITEWETYFNFGLARHAERFHPPAPFATLGWPDGPHWPWFVPPARFDFENFSPASYAAGGVFAGLSPDYEPGRVAEITEEKSRRYRAMMEAGLARKERRQARRKALRKALPELFRRAGGGALVRMRRRQTWQASRGGVPGAPTGPINIAGLYRFGTGLGNAAQVLASTVERSLPGSVRQADISHFFWEKRPGRAADVREGAGTLVVCANPPQGARYLRALPTNLRRGKRIVGYWWWEYPTFPESWREHLFWFDEIWVSSRFLHAAWRSLLDKPVRWVPLDLRGDAVPPAAAVGGPATKLLSIFNLGSTLSRKNPAAAVALLDRLVAAGHRETTLTLKVGGIGQYPQRYLDLLKLDIRRERVNVVIGDLGEGAIADLLASHDVYVSLHRAEGLGMLPARAMWLRKAALATRWSGNLDYMDEGSGVLVAAIPIMMRDENGNTREMLPAAEPDVADAAARLSPFLDDRAKMQALGARAHARIETIGEAAVRFNRENLTAARPAFPATWP